MSEVVRITVSIHDGLPEQDAMAYAESMVRKFTTEDEHTGSGSVAYSWIDPKSNTRYASGIVSRNRTGNLSVAVYGGGRK